MFKDYCGVLTEEAIRKNFILIYELLDEVIDFGYAQTTSTENLKAFVYNEPIIVESRIAAAAAAATSAMSSKTKSSASAHKPITAKVGAKTKNEIFVDILERLSVLFAPNGHVLNATIDGCIQMKSYLAGNPELRLALNEDLIIGKGGGSSAYGAAVLDDCNFHECVRLDEFETSRTLSFYPPDGEFVALNYRTTSTDFRAPFRLFPNLEEESPYKLVLTLLVSADIPDANYGSNVTLRVPMPKACAGVSCELPQNAAGQTAEYAATAKQLVWQIKKFQGQTEHQLVAKLALESPCTIAMRKEVGPIAMSFEIPMYNVSKLQVRYLRIAEQHKTYNPYRWVRYVTQSNSYVIRL